MRTRTFFAAALATVASTVDLKTGVESDNQFDIDALFADFEELTATNSDYSPVYHHTADHAHDDEYFDNYLPVYVAPSLPDYQAPDFSYEPAPVTYA